MSDKRKVDLIEWDDGKECVRSNNKRQLYYWQQYLGDHEICWVSVHEENGTESARYAAKNLLSIHFSEEQ